MLKLIIFSADVEWSLSEYCRTSQVSNAHNTI